MPPPPENTYEIHKNHLILLLLLCYKKYLALFPIIAFFQRTPPPWKNPVSAPGQTTKLEYIDYDPAPVMEPTDIAKWPTEGMF